MRIISKSLSLLMTLLAFPAFQQASLAHDDYVPEKLPFGTVTSADAFTSGSQESADALLLQAEYESSHGDQDKAISLCRRALKVDPDDIDVHLGYAQCLEKKLKKQVNKDPELFTSAVREWLTVLRNEVGDEKGISNSKGLSLPSMQKFYEDEDRTIPARQHLTSLVGYVPRPHETDQKYLARVSRAARASVSARLVSKPKTDSTSTR